MLKLNPAYLRKNGRPQFVVLPYDEFVQLQEHLEDADDLRALRAAIKAEKKAPTKTIGEVKRRLGIK